MTKTIKEVLVDFEVQAMKAHENGETAQAERDRALSEIEKIMDGVIGEDEPELLPAQIIQDASMTRNELREYQRQVLKFLLGE